MMAPRRLRLSLFRLLLHYATYSRSMASMSTFHDGQKDSVQCWASLKSIAWLGSWVCGRSERSMLEIPISAMHSVLAWLWRSQPRL